MGEQFTFRGPMGKELTTPEEMVAIMAATMAPSL